MFGCHISVSNLGRRATVERVWRAKSHDDCCANVLGTTFQQIKTSDKDIDNMKDVTTKCHWITYSKCHLSNLCHWTWDVPASSCRNGNLPRTASSCLEKTELSWGPSFISGGLFGKSAGKFRTALKIPPSYLRCTEHVAKTSQPIYLSVSWFCIVHDLSISFF